MRYDLLSFPFETQRKKKKKNDPSNPYYIFDQRGVVETPAPPLSRIVKTFIRQE